MSIYIPYFYIIQDVRNGIYYAGSKYAQDANPATFMIEGGYTTSSKEINSLIEQHGLNNFIIRKIRTFETAEEAYGYETRFLEKVDARRNPRFYNGHNNTFFAFGTKEFKEFLFHRIGAENPSSLEWVKVKKKETFSKKYGVDNPQKSNVIREKTRNTNLIRYGGNSPFNDPRVIEKFKDNNLEKYGYHWPMERQEVKDKRKENYILKYGVDMPIKNEVVKQKSINTLNKNYGVSHNSQIPEVKNLKRIKEQIKLKRSELHILEYYSKKFNIKLGGGWKQRKDIWVYTMLKEFYSRFGALSDNDIYEILKLQETQDRKADAAA